MVREVVDSIGVGSITSHACDLSSGFGNIGVMAERFLYGSVHTDALCATNSDCTPRGPSNESTSDGFCSILILRRRYVPTSCTRPYGIVHDSRMIDLLVRKFGDKIGRGAVRYGKLDDTSYTLLEHTKKPSTPSVPHVIPVLDIGQDDWDVDDIIIIMPSVSDLNDNRTNTLAICDLPSRQDLITSAPLSTGTRAAAAVDVECCAIYTAIGAQSTPDSYIIITEGIIGSVTLHDDDGSYQGINIMYWIHGSCLNISHQLGPTGGLQSWLGQAT